MKTFHAVFSLFLIATGTVVFLHTIVEPVYFTTTEEQPASPLWKIIEIHAAIALGYFLSRLVCGGTFQGYF